MFFNRFSASAVLGAGLVMASLFVAQPVLAGDKITIELEAGSVVIELNDKAPKHAARIKALVESGKYNDVAFHRVIEGFMAQTGDVQFGNLKTGFNAARVGTGSSDLPDLEAEFSTEASFKRGTIGMARSASPDSANSQFFIMFAAAPHLNGQYTVVGEVVSGMEHVDAIKRGNAAANGVVDTPDRMKKVSLGEVAEEKVSVGELAEQKEATKK